MWSLVSALPGVRRNPTAAAQNTITTVAGVVALTIIAATANQTLIELYDNNENLTLEMTGSGAITGSGNLRMRGDIQFDTLDCTSFANNGKITGNADGVLGCSNDEIGSGAIISLADQRYVRISGSTSTGTQIMQSGLSGSWLHAEENLSSSGSSKVVGSGIFGGTVFANDLQAANNLIVLMRVASDLIPAFTNTYSLGTDALRWFDIKATTGNFLDIVIPSDTGLLQFGLVQDATIGYDGDNLVINPKAVGTGYALFSGDISADNFKTVDAETGGPSNVIVGDGGQSMTGNGNFLMGSEAGRDLVDGNQNIMIGNLTGRISVSDSENVLIGSFAGLALNGGSRNMFIGFRAGDGVTTGDNNVAIGFQAGRRGLSKNVKIGDGAGRGVIGENHSFNVMIGYNSGKAIETGESNVLLGMQTGLNLTTGDGNILIGRDAGALLTTESNRLNIANSSTPVPLIYGEFDNAMARIHGELSILDPTALGSEVLSATDFVVTIGEWSVVGDFAINGGTEKVDYVHSGGLGTLTQASVNFATPLLGDTYYILTYTITNYSNGSFQTHEITTGILDTALTIPITNATRTVLLKTKATPGDFVISVTSNGTSDFTLDNISLKPILGGTIKAGDTAIFVMGQDGNVSIPADSQKLQFGAAQDYSIEWDGDDAVHTITAGDFVFTGGDVEMSDNLDVDGTISGTLLTQFLSGSDLTTLIQAEDVYNSAGKIGGGEIIEDLDAKTVTVLGGTGAIRIADDHDASLLFFNWTTSGSILLNSGSILYLGIKWNGGAPFVTGRLTNTWNLHDEFPLGGVVLTNNDIHTSDDPHFIANFAGHTLQRFYEAEPIMRDEREGGLILGETGDRSITVTAGALWDRVTRFPISALDTSLSGSFDAYYRDGGVGFTATGSQVRWDALHYDDDSGTLAALGNNKYGVLWFYIETDGNVVMVYGREQHNFSAAAEMEPTPTTVPPRLTLEGKLIGRLIFQQNAASSTEISTVFATVFAAGQASDHGNLAGLTGDDHAQYLLLAGRGGQTISDALTLSLSLAVATTLSGGTTVTFSSLRECDTIDTDAQGVLSCGTDDSGGAGSSFGTGNTITIGDPRYVNLSGDEVMTGALAVQGALSGWSLHSGLAFSGAGLTDCDTATTSKLLWDSTTEQFSCGTDTDTNTESQFGTGNTITIGDARWLQTSGGAMTGVLAVQGNMTGWSLHVGLAFSGAGLVDCNANNKDRLQWDDATDQFSCDTDDIALTTDTSGNYAAGDGEAGNATSGDSGDAFFAAGTVDLNQGGTNANLTAANGGIIYSTASAFAVLAAGSSGQTLHSGGAGAPIWKDDVRSLTWYIGGGAQTGTGQSAIVVMPFGGTLIDVTMTARAAPFGQSLIVDINEDGTSVFTTRPEIDAGAVREDNNHSFSDTDLDPGDVLSLDIDQVGTDATGHGTGITIMLLLNRHP